MITLHIDKDEWYPVYDLEETEDDWSIPFTLSEEDYEEYKRLMYAFNKWQECLGKHYEFARKNK